MTVRKLSDPPHLVALCREDEHGEEEIAGWAMVFPDKVVSYVPDPTSSATACTFQSLDSAEWILGYTDVYPVRDYASR